MKLTFQFSTILLLSLVCAIGSSDLEAKNPYRKDFFDYYGSLLNGTQLDDLPSQANHCGVCHYDFSGGGDRNLYGQDFEALPHGDTSARYSAFLSLEVVDSDSDGFDSGVEIGIIDDGTSYANTPTFPGLSNANVGQVANIPTGEVSPYLVPSVGVDTTPPTVTVTTPNGGGTVVGNSATLIEWTADDPESGIVEVEVYEFVDGGYKHIVKGLGNTGSYTWSVANRPRTDALIRIEVVNGAGLEAYDDSDGTFTVESPPGGLVGTTLRDFDMPGSQPFEGGSLTAAPEDCATCHGDYDVNAEPYHNWKGSMMALASLDPLFEANMAIANQDAPDSGDLCLRCHTSRGWIQGRSVPTDGTSMLQHDKIGVSCDMCHRMVDPNYADGISPTRDAEVLGDLSFPFPDDPAIYGNGMSVIDELATHKRGPFDLAASPGGHDFFFSPFHRTGEFCGTCHDVSNPAFIEDEFGVFQIQTPDAPNTTFSPHSIVPVERTYSEWKASMYNTPLGVYSPEFAGNKAGGMVSTCQDCHMSDVLGYGANPLTNTVPERPNMPLHDMTGGSTWLPALIANGSVAGVNPADFPHVDLAAVQDGIARAEYMLQNAATLSEQQTIGNLIVRVTNETGHKLPTGYPEGRRIWVNVKFFDGSDALISESAAYDGSTGVLSHDAEAKIYEVHPGIDTNVAAATGLPEGPSLHFVLNNKISEDNRIPPRGFTNAAFAEFGGSPVGHSYADGQHWDDSAYTVPAGAVRAEVNLYYQSTSKEFIEFLKDENTTNSKGQEMYDLWNNNGKCPPTLMATANVQVLEAGGDEDGDGLSNIEERAFGSDPRLETSAHRPTGLMVEHEGSKYFALRFTRLKDLGGTQINAMVSTDLANWDPAGSETEEYSVADNLDGTETVILRMLTAPAPGEKQFMRLEVLD